jgi:hypothetical protein
MKGLCSMSDPRDGCGLARLDRSMNFLSPVHGPLVASTAPSASLLHPSSSGPSSAYPIRFFHVTSAPSAAKHACIIYSPFPLLSPHLSFLTYLFKPGTSWELLSKPNPIQFSWMWKCLFKFGKGRVRGDRWEFFL